jgi:organic radical activating enzyme
MEKDDLYSYWDEQGWLFHLHPPNPSHVIITGGEPLLHQEKLPDFLRPLNCPIEVETNGTIVPRIDLEAYVTHFNVSPKLKSSGNAFKKAYISESLYWFARDKRATFKFVVQRQTLDEDWAEIRYHYIQSFSIPRDRIWLMPEGADRDAWILNAGPVADLCKRERVHFSPRLQLIIWDSPTGV